MQRTTLWSLILVIPYLIYVEALPSSVGFKQINQAESATIDHKVYAKDASDPPIGAAGADRGEKPLSVDIACGHLPAAEGCPVSKRVGKNASGGGGGGGGGKPGSGGGGEDPCILHPTQCFSLKKYKNA